MTPGRGPPFALAAANCRKSTNPERTKKKLTKTSRREYQGPQVASPTAPVANVTWAATTPVAAMARSESRAGIRDRTGGAAATDTGVPEGRVRVYLVVTFRRY
jgi:hypothetical protein